MTETEIPTEVHFDVTVAEQPAKDRIFRWRWEITDGGYVVDSGEGMWRWTQVLMARAACRRHARARLNPDSRKSRFTYNARWER